MNDNLRKLTVEAKLVGAQFEEGVRYYVGTEDTFNKFAELIVRECAEICLEANDHKNILKHFGVEE